MRGRGDANCSNYKSRSKSHWKRLYVVVLAAIGRGAGDLQFIFARGGQVERDGPSIETWLLFPVRLAVLVGDRSPEERLGRVGSRPAFPGDAGDRLVRQARGAGDLLPRP